MDLFSEIELKEDCGDPHVLLYLCSCKNNTKIKEKEKNSRGRERKPSIGTIVTVLLKGPLCNL